VSAQHGRGWGSVVPERRGALADLTVLDLSMVWAGPYCTKLFADAGARVIKIEVNSHLDSVRGSVVAEPGTPIGIYPDGDPGQDPWNRAGYFNKYNRNKVGVCLNIVQPEGRAVFLELVAIADVVIENFGGGVFERIGYGYDVLREANPDVIFVSMPPSGNGGPEGRYVGYGVAIEQIGGVVAKTGYRGEIPMKSGINYGDPIAGIHTAGYILAALHHRRRTGRGSYIDLSQREATICWLGEDVVEHQLNGRLPERIGNRDRFMAPSGAYRCAGEDDWVALAIGSLVEWRGLTEAMGRPELGEDERFATLEGRRAHHDEIDAWITEWTRGRSADEAMAALQGHGVAAGVVADNRRVVEDRHMRARGFWPEVEHPSVGPHAIAGPAWHLSRTPCSVQTAAPRLGQHTEWVLREVLGKSEAEIEALRAAGTIEDTPAELLEASAD
jgi:crotonobetainyl-CoA:carnitine CoA-transferase CaiB-like acyl-CoA transferase